MDSKVSEETIQDFQFSWFSKIQNWIVSAEIIRENTTVDFIALIIKTGRPSHKKISLQDFINRTLVLPSKIDADTSKSISGKCWIKVPDLDNLLFTIEKY